MIKLPKMKMRVTKSCLVLVLNLTSRESWGIFSEGGRHNGLMQWTCVERSGVETWKGHCVFFLKK